MTETVERRYLGGIRFVDAASGAPIVKPLTVSSGQATFFTNRSGIFVVQSAAGLDEYVDAFAVPPASPSLASIVLQAVVFDPAGRYLPRTFTLALPRAADTGVADSVFEPLEVVLFPAGWAMGESTWASVRASLRSTTAPEVPLAGAFARVLRESDLAVLGVGMSELAYDPVRPERTRPTAGELLVFVPDIPVTVWGNEGEPVLVHEVDVRLEVVFDPASQQIPDPDALSALPVPMQNQWSFKLAAGRTHRAGSLNIAPS